MIYINDEATGVTVEDSKAVDGWIRVTPGPTPLTPSPLPWHFPDVQTDALLRGLLRWKLDTVGLRATADVLHAVWSDWKDEKERSR
jgi:hypothetical protein